MYSVQVVNDIRGMRMFLLLKGPKAAPARKVAWVGFNAHQAFLALYRTMSANQ